MPTYTPGRYTPDRGDIIWLQLASTPTSTPSGQNPVLVISPRAYNHTTGLLLACPITSQVKGYPFEVAIAQNFLDGVILADQIASLDWPTRNPKLILKATPQILNSTLDKIKLLLVDHSPSN